MQRRSFVISLLSLGVGSVVLPAHDSSKHKGKAWRGEVAAVEAESFVLQTDKGPFTIRVTDETKFERGDEKAAFEQLGSGMKIAVFGTVLGSGNEMVAKEVVLEESEHHHQHGHKH